MNTTYTGNQMLLHKSKIAFLSSRNYPETLFEEIEEWIKSLDMEKECILCNHYSLLEKQVLFKLLELQFPIILIRTEGFSDKLQQKIDQLIKLDKILIIDLFYEYPLTLAEKARKRLQYIIDLADHTVIGYCRRMGNIEQLIRGKDNVTVVADERPYFHSEQCVMHFQYPNQKGTVDLQLTDRDMGHELIIEQLNYAGGGKFKRDRIVFDRSDIGELKKTIGLLIEMDKLQKKRDKEERRKSRGERYRLMIENQRRTYPKAFMPWKEKDEMELMDLYKNQQLDIKEIAEQIGRSTKAVKSRLKLIYKESEKDDSESENISNLNI